MIEGSLIQCACRTLGFRALLHRARYSAPPCRAVRHRCGALTRMLKNGNATPSHTLSHPPSSTLTGRRSGPSTADRLFPSSLPFWPRPRAAQARMLCSNIDPLWTSQPLPLRSLAARTTHPPSRCFGLQDGQDGDSRAVFRCRMLELVKPFLPL